MIDKEIVILIVTGIARFAVQKMLGLVSKALRKARGRKKRPPVLTPPSATAKPLPPCRCRPRSNR